jgi:hypothetical protein
MRQVSYRIWDIYFSPIKLAQFDTYEYRLIHLPRRRRKTNERKKEQKSKKVLPMCPV